MREYIERHLNTEIFDALINKDGMLHELLEWVKRDDTLDMEFRGNRVDVYYRGGVLLSANIEGIQYNLSYIKKEDRAEVNHNLNELPFYKQRMDFWFVDTKQAYEREFAQLICRVNNGERPGRYTDFFILDMELEYGGAKPDLVAVKIPAQGGSERTRRSIEVTPHELVFIEVKYGDKAILSEDSKGKVKPGVYKHFKDYKSILSDEKFLEKLCEDMKIVFMQKLKLGLLCGIHANPDSINISKEKADYIYAFANRTPRESDLIKEINRIISEYGEADLNDIYVIKSSEIGYGLYSEKIVSLSCFYDELKI